MKAKSKLLTVVVAVFILMSFPGCSNKEDESPGGQALESDSGRQVSTETAQDMPDDNSNEQTTDNDTSINAVLTSWKSGQKDATSEQFVSIDWTDTTIFNEMPILQMSEKQSMALSANERNILAQEAIELLNSLRRAMFYVVSQAMEFADSGDIAKAKQYLSAVRQYGVALAGPDHLEVVRNHGKAATEYADRKLSEIE
jgi:hypothetical protein